MIRFVIKNNNTFLQPNRRQQRGHSDYETIDKRKLLEKFKRYVHIKHIIILTKHELLLSRN